MVVFLQTAQLHEVESQIVRSVYSYRKQFWREILGATPAEAVSFNSSKIAWRISCAIHVADPEHCVQSVTSK